MKHMLLLVAMSFILIGQAQTLNFFSPVNGVVGQYEKMEFSVNTLASTQTLIDNFFGDGGYGRAFNLSNGNINPYDPDQISIEVTFTSPSNPSIPAQVIYGFYYREYSYSQSTMDLTTTYIENKTLSTHWRVRFAPKYLGQWIGKLVIRHNGVVIYSDAVGKTFTCVASANKGFVQLGANKKYLKYSNGDEVFPVGVCTSHGDPYLDGDMTKHSPIEYNEFRKTLNTVADGGANYTKICFTPYSFQIEWEKLNVYDAYPGTGPVDNARSRQAVMWEFDNVLDLAKNKNLLLHLSLDLPQEGFVTYKDANGQPINYAYHWPTNPYKSASVQTVDDFFSDPNAIKTYNKRIRYMIARWGYSTNIAHFEILNEVDYLSDAMKYPTPANFTYCDNILTNWHNAIANHIKVTLNHKEHLVGTCFGIYDFHIASGSSIDANNPHVYSMSRDAIERRHVVVTRFAQWTQKPNFLSEFGSIFYDNGCAPLEVGVLEAVKPTFHGGLWASVFTGSPISGLDWYAYTPVTPRVPTPSYILAEFPVLKKFMAGTKLDVGNFVPQKYPLSPLPANHDADILETFMLVNNGGVAATEILGWTNNKTYYWKNLSSDVSCKYYDNKVPVYETMCNGGYSPEQNMLDDSYNCPLEGQLGTFVVNGVIPNKKYGVEWYSTSTGEMIKTDLVMSSSSSQLTIAPPAMINTNMDYAFKIRVFTGPCSVNDRLAIAVVEGNTQKSSIVLNNRCNQANGAIRSINISNNNQFLINHGIDKFDGWMDESDKLFIADVNADNVEDMILVNTTYSMGAIRSVDLKTGADITRLGHGTYSGWMDATDKMFVGDVNGDAKADLILVNTSYTNGAIRVVDLATGSNIVWINHGDFGDWMDASDKMFLGDVNGDNKKDLVLVNTSYSGGAIRVINLTTGGNLAWISHGDFGGWMDGTDRMFVGDVNADAKEDLVLLNTAYAPGVGAVRSVSLQGTTVSNLAWVSHTSSLFQNWMDASDKILLEDVNGDNKKDLVFANTDGVNGYLKAFNIVAGTNIATLTSGPFSGWLDCSDRLMIGDVTGNTTKEVVLVNSANNFGAFLAYNFVTATMTIKNHSDYTYGLNGWKDGADANTICGTIPSGANPYRSDEEIVTEEQGTIITVYPNPSSGSLIIAGVVKQDEVKIYSLLGAELYSKEVTEIPLRVDAGFLSNGIYFVEVNSNGNKTNVKIIIEK
ncbi:MAG: T9SS type A sorting domain-containing protein [Bacteroidetes bacterium]|nr:T9SS type A sorting domain-containing protein [Bacteroidota bacterium]